MKRKLAEIIKPIALNWVNVGWHGKNDKTGMQWFGKECHIDCKTDTIVLRVAFVCGNKEIEVYTFDAPNTMVLETSATFSEMVPAQVITGYVKAMLRCRGFFQQSEN